MTDKKKIADLEARLADAHEECLDNAMAINKSWNEEKDKSAALTASLASMKNDWEIASRVADNYKAQMENAVRIGCENITAREKAEASLASITKERDEWAKKSGIAEANLQMAEHGPTFKAMVDSLAELRKRMGEAEKVVDAVSKYRQAVKDHSQDPCQCRGPKCLGDCGPNLAHYVLAALAALASPPSPALDAARAEGENQ